MALPKRRTSKSRKGMRRSHDRITVPTIIYCSCGSPALSHRVCPGCGIYKGRQYLQCKAA